MPQPDTVGTLVEGLDVQKRPYLVNRQSGDVRSCATTGNYGRFDCTIVYSEEKRMKKDAINGR